MDAVEEIKSRLSIEDVVSEYVQLKRAGRNFKGLSPWTNEKSPSFTVSPEKQIWHDFSSNRGGDMFTFVQEMEGVDFKGALDILARRAGVDLEQFQKKGRGDSKEKDRLYELLELATRFYQVQFSKSQLALQYVLKQRLFSKDTAITWRLGYSPNTGDALTKFAKSKGFNERELQQAGLLNRFRTDLFRGRLMVPLQDPTGRVIGFTARQLDQEPNAPKYINTPQTPLYDKSRHVYGLHLAKQAIRKEKYSVLAEGNLDVIASHQAGVAQCVATAGTALTEYQLKALYRLSADVRLAFDADRAGIAAAERAIPIASKVDVRLSVITIPSGKDPDELIKQDAKLWGEVIANPQQAMDWLIDYYKKYFDLTTSQGKVQFRDKIFSVLQGSKDRVEKEHYARQVARLTHVSEDVLVEMALDGGEHIVAAVSKQPKVKSSIDRNQVELVNVQNKLISLLLLQPKLRDILDSLEAEYLFEDRAVGMLDFLKQNSDFVGSPTQAAALRPFGDYSKILVLQYEDLYQGLELLELRFEAERLTAHLVEHYVKSQKHQISQKLQSAASGTEELELLQQDKYLNELLHKFKRG